jgi:hypothetical protein
MEVFKVNLHEVKKVESPVVEKANTPDAEVNALTLEAKDAADSTIEIENAQQLFETASRKCKLFRTPDHDAFAVIEMEDHSETWAIQSKHFRLWLSRFYYKIANQLPKSKLIRDTIDQFEGEAQLNSPVKRVFVRYARFKNEIYIDLANKYWQQIKITGDDCSIISDTISPVRFIRTPGTLPLPEPIFGESLEPLWDFFNIEHSGDGILIISWLIGAMRPEGPFPVLILQGEQGTAKTTIARILCNLLDPKTIASRSLPRSERDLAISANRAWVLSYDNLSGLKAWQSDAFCRVCTGGGLATRMLFRNDSEMNFALKRPLILNGISDLATRHDLADRAIIVNLPPIPEKKRKSEREILSSWIQISPLILGALYVAVSAALRNIDKVKLEKPPRMADFAEWITAAESALPWEKGAFLKEYQSNRDSLIDIALEADPVGTTVLEFIKGTAEWSGTPTDLMAALNKIAPKALQRRNIWPKRPNSLSNKLRQVAPALRKKGIEIIRSKSGKRNITIRKIKPIGELEPKSTQKPLLRNVLSRENKPLGFQRLAQSQMVLGNETEPTDPKKVKSIDDHSEDNSGKTRSVSVGSSEGDREQGEI